MPMQGRSRGAHAAGRRKAKRGARKEIDTYTYPVVVSAVDISGHAKVSDLYQQVLTHQAVPVRQQRMQNTQQIAARHCTLR